jgi:hypothetical protein
MGDRGIIVQCLTFVVYCLIDVLFMILFCLCYSSDLI